MPRIRAANIDEHKTLTRTALLSAARELIELQGTAEISTGEVALLAGMGRTTFYDYFSDRDDIIASLVEDELPVVLAEIIRSVDSAQAIPDRLADLAARTIEFVATDRVFGVILHREIGRLSNEAQARIRDSHTALATEMTGLYMRGVEEGLFLRMPPPVAGRLIQDTIMSGARILITGAADIKTTTPAVRAFLLRGLGYDPLTPES